MKITSVTPLPFTFVSALRPMSFFVVRVETDTGLVGYGESCDCFGISYPRILAAVVADAFAPLLIGKELVAVEPLITQLRLSTRREVGEQWASAQARSALEIALWDLVGKEAERSVSSILGRVRDSIRIYAGSSPFLDDFPASFHLELLTPLLERGVSLIKMRIGSNPKQALSTLADLQRLIPAAEFMVDASEAFDLPASVAIGDALAEMNVRWLEEPIIQKRHFAIRKLAGLTRVPLAYGEHLFGLDDALAALSSGELSVIQPDATLCGGINEARDVINIAPHFGARVALHYHAGPVALAANLQVAACSPNADVLEFPFHLLPVLDGLSNRSIFGLSSIVDGQIVIPDAPGLGVDFNEAAAIANLCVGTGF